jgi:hypothetical protein
MRCRPPLQLAANLDPLDDTGDRELLLEKHCDLIDPNSVAGYQSQYQAYIRETRTEIECVKPVFRTACENSSLVVNVHTQQMDLPSVFA